MNTHTADERAFDLISTFGRHTIHRDEDRIIVAFNDKEVICTTNGYIVDGMEYTSTEELASILV